MTTTEHILTAIRTTFGVSDKDIRGPRRHRNVSEARLAAGYFLLTESGANNDDMPKLLHKSRPWGSYALYRCPEVAEMDKRFRAKLEAVYSLITPKAVAA